MVSEVDVYTWIAEYACRHRVADLLSWVFDESNRDAVSLKEISDICLIQALIWLAVVKDKKDNYKAAVTALDTLVDKAADAHCLEYFIRLSLGLRFKDVVHSLTEDVQLKLREHFPGGTFQIKSQYLKNVFTENESFDDFSKTVLVFVDYFTHIRPSAIKELLENYHAPQSMFGTQLTESLKQLTKYLFDCLLSRHPLTKLENLVKQGVRKQLRGRPNTWSKLLVEKLSGVSELNDEHVRSLFLGMQLKKHIASCKDSGGPSKELQLYEAIVPSSVEHENDTQRHRRDENVCPEELDVPDLRKHVKASYLPGCVVKLNRVQVPSQNQQLAKQTHQKSKKRSKMVDFKTDDYKKYSKKFCLRNCQVFLKKLPKISNQQ